MDLNFVQSFSVGFLALSFYFSNAQFSLIETVLYVATIVFGSLLLLAERNNYLEGCSFSVYIRHGGFIFKRLLKYTIIINMVYLFHIDPLRFYVKQSFICYLFIFENIYAAHCYIYDKMMQKTAIKLEDKCLFMIFNISFNVCYYWLLFQAFEFE